MMAAQRRWSPLISFMRFRVAALALVGMYEAHAVRLNSVEVIDYLRLGPVNGAS